MTPPESAKISPTAEISGTYQIDPSALVPASVDVEGERWSLYKYDSRPFIRDEEWAVRLGFARPRNIRNLIKRMVSDGRLGVCFAVKQTGRSGGRPSDVYFLTKGQALKVAAKCETEIADKILDQMVQAFLLLERSAISAQAPALPAPAVGLTEALLPALLQEMRMQREATAALMTARAEERRLCMSVMAKVAEALVTKAPPVLPALPAPAPTVEREWVTIDEAAVTFGITYSMLYKQLARTGRLKSIRRKNAKAPASRKPHRLFHLADLRAALAAPLPDRKWEPPAPAQAALHLAPVIPLKTEPKATFEPAALRDAVNITIRGYLRRTGKQGAEDRQAAYNGVYDLFGAEKRYDPRKVKDKGESALDCVERRGDMAILLMCAQRYCGTAEESGQEASA